MKSPGIGGMPAHSRIEVRMFGRTLPAVIAGLALALVLSGAVAAQQTPSTPGAKVYFVNLKNGATVTSPFKVEFGIKGIGEGGAVAPPAAIVSAINDALRPLGVELNELPLTPERVLAAILETRKTSLEPKAA